MPATLPYHVLDLHARVHLGPGLTGLPNVHSITINVLILFV